MFVCWVKLIPLYKCCICFSVVSIITFSVQKFNKVDIKQVYLIIYDILWYLRLTYIILYYILYRLTVRRYRVFACVAVAIGYGAIILRDAADATDDRFTQSRRKKQVATDKPYDILAIHLRSAVKYLYSKCIHAVSKQAVYERWCIGAKKCPIKGIR